MSKRIRGIIIVAVAVAVAVTASVTVVLAGGAQPYFPEDGENRRLAASLVEDLTAEAPLAALQRDFPASDPAGLRALIAECTPAAQADSEPTVYWDVVPVTARVLLSSPGAPECDMFISWSEADGVSWGAGLTRPSPQDPLATPSAGS